MRIRLSYALLLIFFLSAYPQADSTQPQAPPPKPVDTPYNQLDSANRRFKNDSLGYYQGSANSKLDLLKLRLKRIFTNNKKVKP